MIKRNIKQILARKVELKQLYIWKRDLILNKQNQFTHIFISCLPKSGSTFIANTLRNTLNYPIIQFQPIRGDNEHNIELITFIDSLNQNTITQLHTKANIHNVKCLQKFNIPVVVLTRNIFNSLISFRNHMVKENDQWFMYATPHEYHKWETKKQFDFIIDFVLPWYISYIISWEKARKNNTLKILHIKYEEFTKDNFSTISKILHFYNLMVSNKVIEAGLKKTYEEKEKFRFNEKTIMKENPFNSFQIEKVRKMCQYYPESDIDTSFNIS